MEAIEQFICAMQRRGLIPPANLVADGGLHRCDVEGKNGKGDGAYVLHIDGISAGGFQNHKDGLGWQNWRADIGRRLRAAENSQYQAKVTAMRREREAAQLKAWQAGKIEAQRILDIGIPTTGKHPYEIRKKIGPHAGVKVGAWPQRRKANCLLIPLCDGYGAACSMIQGDVNSP